MFIAFLRTHSISLERPKVSDFDNAGHAYSSVGRTTIVYAVRRYSKGMPVRLSCNNRNSLLPAFRVISSHSSHVALLVIVMPRIFVSVARCVSVRMDGKFVHVLRNQ